MSINTCKNCTAELSFILNEKTGKWNVTEVLTGEKHNCPNWKPPVVINAKQEMSDVKNRLLILESKISLIIEMMNKK